MHNALETFVQQLQDALQSIPTHIHTTNTVLAFFAKFLFSVFFFFALRPLHGKKQLIFQHANKGPLATFVEFQDFPLRMIDVNRAASVEIGIVVVVMLVLRPSLIFHTQMCILLLNIFAKLQKYL